MAFLHIFCNTIGGSFGMKWSRQYKLFFATGVMPSEVNETSIVMIPKRRNQRI
jgi:hypothetical protein